jgi:DNA primase
LDYTQIICVANLEMKTRGITGCRAEVRLTTMKAQIEMQERPSEERQSSPAEARAQKLLQSPYFFNEYLTALEMAGLVGEWRNALVLFIVAVSRLFARPISAFVKGKSSSGKNWLVGRVLSLMPRGRVRELSGASDKAIHYSKDHFRHRVLFLQERDEASAAVHPLRLLISESKLIRHVTCWVAGKLATRKHVARGPVAAISTTTKPELRIDDETRHISIFVDESPTQTRRIVLAQARVSQGLSKEELETWHMVQRLVEQTAANLKIAFPAWFEKVAESVFVDDVSVRRYFPIFVEACRTVCLIRSFQRDCQARESGQIQLEYADFAIAALIFERVFVQSLHRQEGSSPEVRQVVKEISVSKNGEGVQAEDLAERLGIPLHSAYRKLREAVQAGAVRQVNDPEKDNRKFYLPAERPQFLPDPEEFFKNLNCAEDRVRFVHPIKAEWVTYSRRRGKQSRKGRSD